MSITNSFARIKTYQKITTLSLNQSGRKCSERRTTQRKSFKGNLMGSLKRCSDHISKASFDLKYLEKGLFAFKRPQRQLRQYRQDFGKKNVDLDQL